jgi:hypothetical protein
VYLLAGQRRLVGRLVGRRVALAHLRPFDSLPSAWGLPKHQIWA